MHADPLMHAEQVDMAEEARHAALAGEIEQAAERCRRNLQPLDVMSDAVDAEDGDALMAAIHAGDFDAAGREWSRRLAAYITRCAEIECGAAPAVGTPLDELMGRDEWAGALRGLEARFMPLGE